MSSKENNQKQQKPQDSLLPFINPAYVKTIDNLGIHYTNDFYLSMFRLTRPPSNLSYLDAYRSLGFDTEHLGERRAVQAGYKPITWLCVWNGQTFFCCLKADNLLTA